MSAYYRTCPDCGANLDPGERCDCWQQRWRIEVRMPDGDRIGTRINGEIITIIDRYHSQGAELIKAERLSK